MIDSKPLARPPAPSTTWARVPCHQRGGDGPWILPPHIDRMRIPHSATRFLDDKTCLVILRGAVPKADSHLSATDEEISAAWDAHEEIGYQRERAKVEGRVLIAMSVKDPAPEVEIREAVEPRKPIPFDARKIREAT